MLEITPNASSSGTDHEDSDNEEITNHFRKRNWDWTRDACFVCHQSGLRVLRNGANDSSAKCKNKKVSNALRKCSYPHCPVLFHGRCFLSFSEGDFLPNMHIFDSFGEPCFEPLKEGKKWICPQHECNACHQELLRTRSQLGTFISCVECIFAWHRSCVPVGSHHVNRFLDKCVLCPRHNDLEKTSTFNTPYCVVCDEKLAEGRVKCATCIRSFCETCWAKDCKKKRIKNFHDNHEDKFVCGFCICVDHPRIGDYVLALAGRKLYPAISLHADQIPSSLLKKKSEMIDRLEEPGYVLIKWIEGLEIPNYAVVSFRHLVPMPKSFKCSFWKSLKKCGKIYPTVGKLYEQQEVNFGLDRPLPSEVWGVKKPTYKKIESNINGKAALTKIDSADVCFCMPENGIRCNEKCPNRASATECPKNCDELFMKPFLRHNESNISPGKCSNNFLRNYQRQKEEELMEERITSRKGFGVFARKSIAKGVDLAEYLGVVMPKDDYLEKLKLRASHHNLEMSYFGIQLTPQYYLDGRNYGGMARTINHSCDPNCQVAAITVDGVCRLKITSIKDIAQSEEITFDYDSEVQEGLVGTKCRCGSAKCRGFIGKKVVGSLKNRAADQSHGAIKRGRENDEKIEEKENIVPTEDHSSEGFETK